MKDSSKMLLEGIEVGGCGQERMGGEKMRIIINLAGSFSKELVVLLTVICKHFFVSRIAVK